MKSCDLFGVTVATVLPFNEYGEIDWLSYENVLKHCATIDKVKSVFVNGHAGEAASLSNKERIMVIKKTRDFLGGNKPILSGVLPFSANDAILQAQEAQSAGANGYVIFPPPGLGGGASNTVEAPLKFFETITTNVDIPASVFQYPINTGFGYSTDALKEISMLPGVIAIKEGSNCIFAYEENFRTIKNEGADIAFLPSNFNWFLAQLAVGADGLLSGLGSLTPRLLCDLWDASSANDLKKMRSVSDALYPITRCIYGPSPLIDMHTRIKHALKELGVISCAVPRSPLLQLKPDIEKNVSNVIIENSIAEYEINFKN